MRTHDPSETPNLIVVDIETSGLDVENNQILSIGAVDFESPSRTYYDECRLLPAAEVSEEALAVTGFSFSTLGDSSRLTPAEVLGNFMKWANGCRERTLAGENPWFDTAFLRRASREYGLLWPFGHRFVDLHSLSYVAQLRSGILALDLHGTSGVSLDRTLQYVGLVPRKGIHNALADAKLEAEAFSRLIYARNLLEEYSQYRIPNHLAIVST